MKTLREYIDIVEGKQPVFTPEIMPCAKCGSPAQVYGSNVLDYRGQWRVICDKTPVHTMPGENITKNRAVHKWNNRQKEILASQNVQEDENQEYTVRVVDEEGSGYTVKVTATSEQGALHKAIVRVRNSGARPEHARIIRQDVEEQATPEAIARIEQLSSK
jgi:hypothetical protein